MNSQDENKDKTEEFEAEQNVLGLFAILLAVDKRINPQNYEFLNKPEKK